MSATGHSLEVRNPKTGLTQLEMEDFVHSHCEDFVNRKKPPHRRGKFRPRIHSSRSRRSAEAASRT